MQQVAMLGRIGDSTAPAGDQPPKNESHYALNIAGKALSHMRVLALPYLQEKAMWSRLRFIYDVRGRSLSFQVVGA